MHTQDMNPDFDHLEEGLSTAHVELGRVRNIPGLNVNQQLNDIRQAMNEGFRRTDEAIRRQIREVIRETNRQMQEANRETNRQMQLMQESNREMHEATRQAILTM